MTFSDKLNYLFELSNAEGKELAAAMNVTPPQISKMRRGVRGLPKNRESAHLIARFFARRCASDYQRDALSKTMRIAQVSSANSESVLADILLDWLSDERDPDAYAAVKADTFLRRFEEISLSYGGEEFGGASDAINDTDSRFFTYHGSEGKRMACRSFLSYLSRLGNPFCIDILTDESVAWVTEDSGYSKQLYSDMVKLTEQGCYFRRIAGPISDIDQAFESLNRWFPLYLTGKATSYYYKRMRDSLNRITLFVVPGVAAMFSFSVRETSAHVPVTFFTVDRGVCDVMGAEFENYLSVCDPIMNVYRAEESIQRLHGCMIDFDGYKGNCIQRSESLSYITLPWDVARTMNPDSAPEQRDVFLTTLAQRYKKFKANLEQYEFTDIVRLSDCDSVINGTAKMPASCVVGGRPQYYTPAGYLQQLSNMLFLLQHYPRYNVVIRRAADYDPVVIYVKEGFCAILGTDTAPFSIFEVSERFLVNAFAEYLRRLLPPDYGTAAYRKNVIAEIRSLITGIENAVAKTLPDGQPM